MAVLSMLTISSTVFAALDCKKATHPMDVAKCSFLEALTNKSNTAVELAKGQLAAQGFSKINIGEELNAVFVRGNGNRFTYLITTDVASQNGLELKSIGMIISANLSDMGLSPEAQIEKVVTSNSL